MMAPTLRNNLGGRRDRLGGMLGGRPARPPMVGVFEIL